MGREDARGQVSQVSRLFSHRWEKPENPAKPLILQQEAETFLGGRTVLGSCNKCMVDAVSQDGCLPLMYTEVLIQSVIPSGCSKSSDGLIIPPCSLAHCFAAKLMSISCPSGHPFFSQPQHSYRVLRGAT